MHIVCSIWPIDRTLSRVTTQGGIGRGNNGNEGVHYILQIAQAVASLTDSLMSDLEHSLEEESYANKPSSLQLRTEIF